MLHYLRGSSAIAIEFRRSKLRIRRLLAGGWVALAVGWGTTAASGSTDNLLAASARGDVGAVRAQLANGGDVNFRHKAGLTALMLAARDGLESEFVRQYECHSHAGGGWRQTVTAGSSAFRQVKGWERCAVPPPVF